MPSGMKHIVVLLKRPLCMDRIVQQEEGIAWIAEIFDCIQISEDARHTSQAFQLQLLIQCFSKFVV